MKLFERFADRGFHSSIVTTFGIDFDAYEGIALPRLRAAGCMNNMVLADARMLSYALDGASVPPRSAGRYYTAHGVQSRGVFHAKLVLQLGRSAGRLIVASANMTAPGLAGNLEVAGSISCRPNDAGERRLLASAFAYVTQFMDPAQEAVAHQLEWMRRRSSWLFDVEPQDAATVDLADGSAAAFLCSREMQGIAARFSALLGGERVERLIVVSPYWDPELAALRDLADELGAREVAILIDGERSSFPAAGLSKLANATLFDMRTLAPRRFAHAKVVIAQTATADHVLYGSANCTVAALGTRGFPGVNDEASLYQRLGPGVALEALDLTRVLVPEAVIQPSTLPSFDAGPDLPLDAALARQPGRFEASGGQLSWWPSTAFASSTAIVELLDADRRVLPDAPAHVANGPDCLLFALAATDAVPVLARIRADGRTSAPAVIVHLDALREAVREARGRQGERAADRLAEETEEGMWLLEVFDILEAADANGASAAPLVATQLQAASKKELVQPTFSTLAYAEFIAGRRAQDEGRAARRSDLAGTELTLVRAFLNRAIGYGKPEAQFELPDESALSAALALREEKEGAEDDDEALAPSPTSLLDDAPRLTEQQKEKMQRDLDRRKAAHVLSTREHIWDGVAGFNALTKKKAEGGVLTYADMLRMRAMLMIVVASGRSDAIGIDTHKPTKLQVLRSQGPRAWPLLVGQLLAGFFGGSDPPINQLRIREAHHAIPVDILEAWATCYWAINACQEVAADSKGLRGLKPRLASLANPIYRLTGLSAEEMAGGVTLEVYEALSRRFTPRLALDSGALLARHLASAAACSTDCATRAVPSSDRGRQCGMC